MAARFKLRSITDAASVAWHRRRLVEICVQIGHLDTARGLLGQKDYVSSHAADGIRVEVLRRRLAGESGYADPADLRKEFTPGLLGDAAACAAIARHNARHDMRIVPDAFALGGLPTARPGRAHCVVVQPNSRCRLGRAKGALHLRARFQDNIAELAELVLFRSEQHTEKAFASAPGISWATRPFARLSNIPDLSPCGA